MAAVNWRTINIDALDPDSPANFDLSTLAPAVQPVTTADVQSLAGQIRQLLRGGESEGALQGALENPPYGADDKGKVRRSMLPHHRPYTAPLLSQAAIAVADIGFLRAVLSATTAATVAVDVGSQQPGRSSGRIAQALRLERQG
jgi:hypothetical protein